MRANNRHCLFGLQMTSHRAQTKTSLEALQSHILASSPAQMECYMGHAPPASTCTVTTSDARERGTQQLNPPCCDRDDGAETVVTNLALHCSMQSPGHF